MYAATSWGRIGTNGASGSATNENDPFCRGLLGFGQAERAAEPPRGAGIGGGKSSEPKGDLSSEALAKEEAACVDPLSSARFKPSGARKCFWLILPSSWPLWGQHYGGQA